MTAPLRRSALVLAALALGGCGLFGTSRAPDAEMPGAEPPSRLVTVEMAGADDMNAGGNAARVYLYPLASQATFLSTPVQVFWTDPAATLGADLLGTARDATVRPGDTTRLDELALGDAAFLGIAVDLREPVGTTWRTVLPAADVRGKTLTIRVGAGGLQASTR